jgi:5'-nucleotidase
LLILLSNDDGIDSPGIAALARVLEDLGEIWVAAPDREQSATSHSISLDRPLRGVEIRPRWVAVNGTPTDCVYLAVNHLLPRKPDLVLSGINKGPNLGDDVHYSGTVAAAMEGALLGVTSAAISHAGRPPFAFEGVAEAARVVTELIVGSGLPGGTLLNVNIPAGANAGSPRRLTRLGKRRYGNAVDRRFDPRGRPYFWIGGDEIGFEHQEGSDGTAVAEGAISITPLRLDLTDFDALRALRSWERL